jgi:hypothetical protein
MLSKIHHTFRLNKYIFATLAVLFLFPLLAQAQPSGIPLQSPAYHMLDRLDIKSGIESPIHPELKFYSRKDAVDYALAVDSAAQGLKKGDRADIQYLINDSDEWAPDTCRLLRKNKHHLLKVFCESPASFFSVNSKDFKLRVNPMFNFSAGRQADDASLIFYNQRGAEVRGAVDGKLFFYTNLIETQVRFPNYVQTRIDSFKAIPGAGFYKTYKPRFTDLNNAYDFNIATAYLSYKLSKHVGIQLGHGRHFIGEGYRSLFLSDVGNNTFYLKLSTRVWKFDYQNLFMELSPISTAGNQNNALLPKKYAAVHYLNYKITPKLAIGLYEAVIFNRQNRFELQYLNPVILYRTVEGMIGSPDNVLIGFDGHWNLFRRVQLYGQCMIDEFIFSELVNPKQKGWWGNKNGLQAGIKYIDAFGIDHLDLQAEWNRVRPYTYSHYDSLSSYTHYNQPLAHPLWSNFNEFVGIVRYQPTAKIFLFARWMHARTGDNGAAENWGANPLLNYTTRIQDYGNEIGQGIGANIDLMALDASWMFYHNLFVDLKVLLRRKNSDNDQLDQQTKLWSIGLRMNIWNQNADY